MPTKPNNHGAKSLKECDCQIEQAFLQLGNLLSEIADNKEEKEAEIGGTASGNKGHRSKRSGADP